MLILQLDSGGHPVRWITWKKSVEYHAKNLVAWELGEVRTTYHGGTNAITAERSVIVTSSIIAVKGKPGKRKTRPPALNNKQLFRRDRNLCAYCGKVYGDSGLTREHIFPLSRGGADTWENCVSACHACNSRKDDCTPEEAGMKLLYVPYVPSRVESLILQNRNCLGDQMEYLLSMIPKDSKLRH